MVTTCDPGNPGFLPENVVCKISFSIFDLNCKGIKIN